MRLFNDDYALLINTSECFHVTAMLPSVNRGTQEAAVKYSHTCHAIRIQMISRTYLKSIIN